MDITVAMTAWPKTTERLNTMRQACGSMKTLTGPIGRWVLSCESRDVRPFMAPDGWEVRMRKAPPCLGAHLNELYASLAGSPVFYCQDDMVLARPLDLTGALQAIVEHGADFVRFRYHPSKRQLAQGHPQHFANGETETFHRMPDHLPHYSAFAVMVAPDWYSRFGPIPALRTHEAAMDAQMKDRGAVVWLRQPNVMRHIGRHSLVRPGKVYRV